MTARSALGWRTARARRIRPPSNCTTSHTTSFRVPCDQEVQLNRGDRGTAGETGERPDAKLDLLSAAELSCEIEREPKLVHPTHTARPRRRGDREGCSGSVTHVTA